MIAVIQAGGRGTRLKPYTLVLPKPLMPVGGHPVVELLLKWLRRNGIKDIYITIGYLGHLIKALCGDGLQWDLCIRYSEETEPMGTVGALQLLREHLKEPFLVLNGDLLTDLDLRAFMAFHVEHGGLLSVGVTEKTINVDLGVIEADGGIVTGFRERPSFKFDVSMGVYCMDPGILEWIPKGVPYGFDDLMLELLEKGQAVHIFRHAGLWMDIGRPDDFEKAQGVAEED